MKTAVCVCAKMENHYIREWVEYYKKLGFTNIILYDNNDIDGEKFDEVVGDYINDNFIIVENIRGEKGGIQGYAFLNCIEKYEHNYDYIAFFDVDEFLELGTYNNIQEYLSDEKMSKFSIINVCWKLYGDNDLLKVENNNYNVRSRFTKETHNEWTDNLVKAIIKMDRNIPGSILNYQMFPAHFGTPKADIDKINRCNANGEPCKQVSEWGDRIDKPVTNNVYLAHYITKTIEEAIQQKIFRGYPNVGSISRTEFLVWFKWFNKLTPEKEKLAAEMLSLTEQELIESLLSYIDTIFKIDKNKIKAQAVEGNTWELDKERSEIKKMQDILFYYSKQIGYTPTYTRENSVFNNIL